MDSVDFVGRLCHVDRAPWRRPGAPLGRNRTYQLTSLGPLLFGSWKTWGFIVGSRGFDHGFGLSLARNWGDFWARFSTGWNIVFLPNLLLWSQRQMKRKDLASSGRMEGGTCVFQWGVSGGLDFYTWLGLGFGWLWMVKGQKGRTVRGLPRWLASKTIHVPNELFVWMWQASQKLRMATLRTCVRASPVCSCLGLLVLFLGAQNIFKRCTKPV